VPFNIELLNGARRLNATGDCFPGILLMISNQGGYVVAAEDS
jgi:hypothetical protein